MAHSHLERQVEDLRLRAAELERNRTELESANEELRRENAELEKNESRFRLLVDGIEEHAMLLLDLEGRVTSWNEGAERLFGCMAEEVIGRPVSAFYVEEDVRLGVLQRELQHVRSRGRAEQEGWRVRKDGSRFWASVVVAPLHDEFGMLFGFAKAVHDLTGRKRAEDALRESEERYRSLFQNAPIGIYRTTPTGEILAANPAMVEMLGFSSFVEFAAHGVEGAGYATPDRRSEFREQIERSGEVAGFESEWLRRDGVRLFIRENARAVPGPGGDVLYYEGTMEDITEQRQAAQERERSLSLLRATLESTADGILVVDREGTVEVFNQQFATMWGIPPSVLATAKSSEFLSVILEQVRDPAEFQQRVQDLYASVDAEGSDVLHLKDGRSFERYSRPRRVGKEFVGRVWSFRDLTEQRRLEEQFRHAQKMEAVGRLSGGIAHDFNNLLTAILGNADLLLMDIPPADPMREDLEEIRGSAKRAASLTNQLLAFSRKQVIQPRVLDPNEMITGTDKLLRRLIGAKVELVTLLDPELGRIRGDAGQFEQVLVNLAINACDAMPAGGRLVIETRNTNLTAEDVRRHFWLRPGSYVEIRVTDTGTGICPEDRERIFEPFFTTKELGKGTGLGLSTVYGIVKQSDGFVYVESEPGRGSAFRILLPRVEQENTPTAAPVVRVRSVQGSETILLVEDEGMVRDFARKVLSRAGYTVLEASNGEEALRSFERNIHPIHLLLTDMVMPLMGGGELAGRIRELRPDLGILFISGYTADRITCTPGIDFLEKPFSPDTLLEKVREVLDVTECHARASEHSGAR